MKTIVGMFLVTITISPFTSMARIGGPPDYHFAHPGSCSVVEKSNGFVNHGYWASWKSAGEFRAVCLAPDNSGDISRAFVSMSEPSFDAILNLNGQKQMSEPMMKKFLRWKSARLRSQVNH